MAREGLMDDTGYRGFNECLNQEECNKEAYEKGLADKSEEVYLDLITEIDLLNSGKMSAVDLYNFACKIKLIADKLKGVE